MNKKITIKRIIAISCFNSFEYYDIAVYAGLSSIIANVFFPTQSIFTSTLLVWLTFSLRFLTRPFGGIIFGYLSDRLGRKKSLIFTSFSIGIATISICILPTYQNIGIISPIIFIILQMIQSISFGGEYPTIITYLMEKSLPKDHIKTSSIIVSSSLIGILTALLIVFYLKSNINYTDMTNWGWRIPYLIGSINIIFGLNYRIKLEESYDFKKIKFIQKNSLNKILIFKIILITAPAAIIFYLYTVSGNNIISHFFHKNLLNELANIFNITALIISIFIVGFLLGKKLNSKKIMIIGSFSLILFAMPYYVLSTSDNMVTLISIQILLAIISAFILSPLAHMIFYLTTENNRTLSLGVGYNISLTIFGGTAPTVAILIKQYSSPILIGAYLSIFGVASLIVLWTSCPPMNE